MKVFRNLLDGIKPNFEKGGKLEKLYPAYDAFETFHLFLIILLQRKELILKMQLI